MPNFTGQLNANTIQSALFNMIISQDVIGGSIKANYNLVDKARVDGSLYGDTKLFIDVPTLVSVPWVQDSDEMLNVLKTHRPEAPKVQAITMDVFRQCALTKDDFLSKQAFGTESAFVSYQSILERNLNKTKDTYDDTTYNAFFGTVDGTVTEDVDLSSITATGEEKNRLEAQTIARKVADIIADMKDYNNKYTKNGFLRAFGDEDIHVVWNVDYINKITKLDLPTIYHKDGVMDKFGEEKLPSHYFGTVETNAVTASDNTGSYRSLVEQIINGKHYLPGKDIDAGVAIAAGTAYIPDDKVICKIYTKLPPYMSAFNVGTSFYNPRNLSTNMYLTWGHNTLEALDSEAIVTVRAD